MQEPLKNAVYTRLNGINVPELSAVHFAKTDNLTNVFCKRLGHLSLCAVHFFLKLFVFCGSAELREEIPKAGFRSPIDFYGGPLKEFWFKFSSAPAEQVEPSFLSSLESIVPAESNARKQLMSPYPASQATTDKPFLLSLSALLVVTGFSHVFTKYYQDNRLLQLQAVQAVAVAVCGPSRKFTFEWQCDNNNDVFLNPFNLQSTSNLQQMGCLHKMGSA